MVDYRFDVAKNILERNREVALVGHAGAPAVKTNDRPMLRQHLVPRSRFGYAPHELVVKYRGQRVEVQERRAVAQTPESDVHPVGRLGVLKFWRVYHRAILCFRLPVASKWSGLQQVLVLERSLERRLHHHLAELGDGEIEVLDGGWPLVWVVAEQELGQIEPREGNFGAISN